jgi:hypothetical protein
MRGRITCDSQGLCSPRGQYCGGGSPENGKIAAKLAVMPAIRAAHSVFEKNGSRFA